MFYEAAGPVDSIPEEVFFKNKITAPRILLIDDEKHIRTLYKMELEDEGYSVVTTGSGFSVIDKIEKEKHDIIILDIKLNDSNGLDILSALKSRFRQMPVGLCTAYEPFKGDMKSIAADFYVVKSHDLTELKQNIASTLESCN